MQRTRGEIIYLYIARASDFNYFAIILLIIRRIPYASEARAREKGRGALIKSEKGSHLKS